MTNARHLFLAGIVLFLLSVAVNAGDYASLNFIGFSKDGRYLAFEEYGTQDGSGYPYSNIYFIDVEKNAYAAKPVTVLVETETATERQARARAKLGATANLRKFRILDRNTGAHVVSRMLTDVSGNHFYSEHPEGPQTINFAEIIGSMYRAGDYELVMKSTEVKLKACEYTDQPTYKLELTLKDNDNKKTTVLQKDASLPASRACALNYAMQHVYLYDNYIAVFLNTYHVGFEGPDMRYMVVTGVFK